MDLHPKSISSRPFYSPVLKAGEIWNVTTVQVTAFGYLRHRLVFAHAAHRIIVITVFGGNEDLNTFTWTFQSLRRS